MFWFVQTFVGFKEHLLETPTLIAYLLFLQQLALQANLAPPKHARPHQEAKHFVMSLILKLRHRKRSCGNHHTPLSMAESGKCWGYGEREAPCVFK